jgi:drug/metabolite transporter (DMT)-like permease
MIPWLLLAVSGHLANAVAFVIDKTLLTTTFRRGATYAALISTLSFIVIVAAPWVKVWPALSVWPWVVSFGLFQTLALWAFFEALRQGEASRVVPVVGSLIPLFTLIGTSVFLHERFTIPESFGFAVLIMATILLASGGGVRYRLPPAAIGLALLASLLFATSFVSGKIAYTNADFLGVFVSSRMFAALAGLVLGLLESGARRELGAFFKPGANKVSKATTVWTVTGQLMGAFGFVLLNIALASGSAPIVNALQAVQYAAIALIGWLGGRRLQKLLKEERTTRIFAMKMFAILLTAVGLWLVSYGF